MEPLRDITGAIVAVGDYFLTPDRHGSLALAKVVDSDTGRYEYKRVGTLGPIYNGYYGGSICHYIIRVTVDQAKQILTEMKWEGKVGVDFCP